MVDLLARLNQSAGIIGTVAMILILISLVILFYSIARLGKADERSNAIVAKVFRRMFIIMSLSMVLFYQVVPKQLYSMHHWFVVFFSLAFIWGACQMVLETR